MITGRTIKKRVFELTSITEEEGIVLRTLLNLNKEGVRKKLKADELYWNGNLKENIAIDIGLELCEKVMNLVDKNY